MAEHTPAVILLHINNNGIYVKNLRRSSNFGKKYKLILPHTIMNVNAMKKTENKSDLLHFSSVIQVKGTKNVYT